jgi:hypothetical protein
MSMPHSCTLAITLLTLTAIALPATAQYNPLSGINQQPSSSNVIIGNGVQVGTPSSVIINGQGYSQPQVIIRPQTSADPQQVDNCTSSLVGSPVPLPYARNSVTGTNCH